jgi:hypothetical protein
MDEAEIDKALVYAAPIPDMDNETLIKAISNIVIVYTLFLLAPLIWDL